MGTTEYDGIIIPDIFKRVIIGAQAKNSNLFDQYEIIEGETPESVSFNYYESVDYYWVILTMNNIASRYFQWPLNSQELGQYVESVYGNKSSLFFTDLQLQSFTLCGIKSISFGSTTKKVLDCDRNLNKLIIEKITDTEVQSDTSINLLDINGNLVITLIPSRVVYENEYAIHHFPDETQNQPRQLLQQYVSGESNVDYVSNLDYETQLNETKRSIVLIRPEYVTTVVNEYKKLAAR